MSRLKVAGLAIAAAMILAGNQDAIAGKPDGKQSAQKASKSGDSAKKKNQAKSGRRSKRSSKSSKSTLGDSSKILQKLL